MFEKEAEEYAKPFHNMTRYDYVEERTHVKRAFIDGAEFGYKKANEWHNIRENPDDLPNEGELIFANNLLTTECVKFKKEKDGNHWKHDCFELCNVVYWKEIVLPEEIKEYEKQIVKLQEEKAELE